MSRHALDSGRKVLGRYVQPLCIVAHIALLAADTSRENSHKLFHDICRTVGMAIGCFTLGMSFEDVVYHCKAETSHQFSVELQMMVSHTVAQAMEIVKQMLCLFISQFY